MLDALRRKRCESLLQKGYARIREGQFDAALEIANQLEEQRHTGGFEIAALAQAGKGELETAVTILQRGVAIAPDVWLNWQLLGNYLSDLERYDDADGAYQRALACPDCPQDSVRLNLAILAERRHRPEIALELLDAVRDPSLLEHAREIRVSSLQALGRLQEALALAESSLQGGPAEDDEGAARWERVAAKAARIRLALRHGTADVQRWILDRLSEAPASAALFRVLRDLDPQHSPAARRFEIFVHGAVPLRSPKRRELTGFFTTYQVAADTPEHGLELIRRHEELVEPEEPANCRSTVRRTWAPPPMNRSASCGDPDAISTSGKTDDPARSWSLQSGLRPRGHELRVPDEARRRRAGPGRRARPFQRSFRTSSVGAVDDPHPRRDADAGSACGHVLLRPAFTPELRRNGMARTKTKRVARRTAARSKPVSRSRKVDPVPPQYGSVTPYLTIRECGTAIDFYKRAFGARELVRMPGPGGTVMHAEIKIGDSIVMMNDESPERGMKSPQSLGGTSGSVMLYVKDCDRVYHQALAAGARSRQEPQDMFWGDRFAMIEDPYGHTWGIATAKEKVSPREMVRRMAAMQPGATQG